MRVKIHDGKAWKGGDKTLAVFVWKDGDRVLADAPVDRRAAEKVLQTVREDGFKGKEEEVVVAHPPGNSPARRVIFCGLGSPEAITAETIRKTAGRAVKRARDLGARSLSIAMPAGKLRVEAERAVAAVAEAAQLATYRFTRHKSKVADEKRIDEVEILPAAGKGGARLAQAAERGSLFGRAASFARDLVNEPPNAMTPRRLEQVARSIAKKGVSMKAFGPAQMKKLGMGAALGVSLGSTEPPRFLYLKYKAPGRARKTVALVGKGITFDSGGLCIKPADGMEHMKMDMGGGAAVLGAFSVIAELQPPVNVIGIIPATENMPGAAAYKPGDVLKALNGKTIEVINTDAEGRVVLADGLAWACKEGADEVIDVATLTGAISIALGSGYSGVFTNDQPLADRVLAAAHRTGERMWQMPMPKDYFDNMKSEVADMRNIGTSRDGGSIKAALFLQQFVEDGTPWVHLDIAGTAWTGKEQPYGPVGATGQPVRTLLEYLLTGATAG
ncbi:MAG: leucyl aminopeptidase [Planctomycetota bacterium]